MSGTQCTTSIDAFASCLASVIINPILALLFAAGFLVFVWGVVEFLGGQNGVGEGAQNGKRHMLWGLIGMFIMVGAYTFIHIINNTLNTYGPTTVTLP